MKRKYFLFVAFFLVIFLHTAAYAHSGRTDSEGGHKNGDTYHFHHGYSAHQHTNGVCPYNFDSKTGQSSGSSSGSSGQKDASKTVNSNADAKKDVYVASAPPIIEEETNSVGKESEKYYLVIILVAVVVVFAIIKMEKRRKKEGR